MIYQKINGDFYSFYALGATPVDMVPVASSVVALSAPALPSTVLPQKRMREIHSPVTKSLKSSTASDTTKDGSCDNHKVKMKVRKS